MRPAASLLILCLLAASGGPALAGETACWFENGAVVVPAAIGGMAGDYVLDLSAPRTLLHETAAQRAGYAETALTLPVLLAGQRTAPGPVTVQDLDYRNVGFFTPILGVIGADILGRYVVTLDFAPCRLDLELLGSAGRPRGRGLGVTVVGGVATVQAAASDGVGGVAGAFALDTASNGGVRARGPADAPRQKPAGTLPALSLDGVLRRDLPAVVAGELPDGVVGALGVQVLAGYRLRLDPAAGRLWLTPVAGHEKGPDVSAGP
ncbi:hypothetical protein [Caulobacter sp. LARHSG274]